MSSATDAFRQHLMSSDAEFQKLVQQHTEFDTQLEQLLNQPYLSGEDRQRQVLLKKMKLRVKDEMERIIAQRRRQAGG